MKKLKEQSRSLLLVLIIFPLLYIGLSLTPWSHELFVKSNDYFYPHFWLSVILLHWVTFFVVVFILKKENLTLRDIGYNLNTKQTIVLISGYAIIALAVFIFTEISLKHLSIDIEKLNSLGNFFPKSTAHRIIFIFVVFTAGFCEEIIYRGFAMTKLIDAGLNKWVSIIPAGIAFVFIHGIIGFSRFGFYFIPAIILGLIFIISKRRLLPGIIVHLIYDLIAMMAVFQAIS